MTAELPELPDAHPTSPAHDVVNAVPVEARSYQGQRAGVVSRTIAGAIDFAVATVVVCSGYAGWAVLLFLLNPTGFSFPAIKPLWLLIAGGAFLFLYFTVLWSTNGQTYGAHVMGLRVVNFRGRRLRLIGATVRAGFCVLVPIGLFWCAVSRQNRSVQDVVLHTSVIYDWQPRHTPGRTT